MVSSVFGLLRVQGAALALLSWNGHNAGGAYFINEPAPAEDDGTKYCRDSGLVQASICGEYCYVESAEATR